MARIERFEDLDVWKKSRVLIREVYVVTITGKFSRDLALRDQIRRAAISILSNIAEGFERGSNKEFIQFLYIAKGSAGEVRAQLHIASDLGYLEPVQFGTMAQLAIDICQMLSRLISYLSQDKPKT